MGIKLYRGNCLDVLPTIAAGSVGMVVYFEIAKEKIINAKLARQS